MEDGTLRSGTIADAICETALPVEMVRRVRSVGRVIFVLTSFCKGGLRGIFKQQSSDLTFYC